MKCFYHGSDMDGKASGAIVRAVYGDQCGYIPYYYKDFPFDTIAKNEFVILVDCSCDFNKLLKITNNVTWIDHHITAIQKYKHLSIRGLRIDGVAACELAYEYFIMDPLIGNEIPKTIKLLGDYDVFKFKYGEDTNKLQAGIRLYDTRIDSVNWKSWLDDKYEPIEEIKQGEIALRYRDSYYRSVIKATSFFAEFEGWKAVCANSACVSSQLFDSVEEDYDLMMPFYFDGNKWTVSIYTKKDNIHVGILAESYGGGGHKQAAGFTCDILPFNKGEKNAADKK